MYENPMGVGHGPLPPAFYAYVQYGHWPTSAKITGNLGRRENTKQARGQGMLEELLSV